MGFETPSTGKKEKEPDLYDTAKEEMMAEKAEEGDPKEFSEKDREKIDEGVAEQLKRQEEAHAGTLEKLGAKARERKGGWKILTAALLMNAGTTLFAGHFSKAEAAGRDRFGLESIVRDVLRDIGDSIGRSAGDAIERGKDDITVREKERQVEQIRREDEDFHRQYLQIMDEYQRDIQRLNEEYDRVIDRLQEQYGREGKTIPANIKKQADEALTSRINRSDTLHGQKIDKINESHHLLHRKKGKAITGCDRPDDYPPVREVRPNF